MKILSYALFASAATAQRIRGGTNLDNDADYVSDTGLSSTGKARELFVNDLSCSEETINVEYLIESALAGLTGSSMDSLEGDDGSAISIASVMQMGVDKLLSDMTHSVMFPQKVCPGVGDDVPTRGEDSGVVACGALDMLSETDVLAFGYHNNVIGAGLCVAFNDDTKTYAIGQTGILPAIKVQALTITLDAIAVSITKQLRATTLNTMWDGVSDPAELTLPGHVVLRGTGSFGLKLSDSVDLTLSCDTTVLVDADYANNGLAPVNGAVDFALLLSGTISPTFNIKSLSKNGAEETLALDLSSVFSTDADLYQYVNGNYKSVQLAVSKNLDLTGLCDLSKPFEVFCMIFKEASFSFAVRAFANNNGFGIQFSFEATMEFKNGFDIIEDLIGWPEDNTVSASIELKLLNKKLSACVDFEGNKFCTGKCAADADCEDTHVCDNVFKVCREKRGNGGKCGRDVGCKSGNCVSGYCRECPTAGSSTGCPSGRFCQRTYGIKTHVCRPKKGNGAACAGNDACRTGNCVSGYCRECPTAGSSKGCPSGEFCQRTYGLQTHVCRPKKGSGAACSGNAACRNGLCVKKYCRVCTANRHCRSGYACRDNVYTGFIKKCCPTSGKRKYSRCYT